MGSRGPGGPGPLYFLLLLLLLPPPLQSTERFLHQLPGWRNFHQDARHQRSSAGKGKSCEGAFDLYFVLDASDSVNGNWKHVHKFVDEMVKKFQNPKLRMSFITYSTQGHTLMKLTSDRNEIRDGLSRLQNVVPTGATNMHEGFKKANEQIQKVYSRDRKAVSLIITLTAGTLSLDTAQSAKDQANRARKMGAKVYCVGVKDYKNYQLNSIVERKDQLYEAEKGFGSLRDIVDMLVVNSCLEVTAGDTYFVCVGEEYEATFYVPGIPRSKKEEIICRYQLPFSQPFNKKPTYLSRDSLVCPGHVFKHVGQKVTIDCSLDNGVSFMGETMTITSINCPDATAVPKTETSVPTTVTRKRTPVPTTVTRKRTPVPTTVTQETPVPTTVTQKETPVPTIVTEKETTVSTTVTQEETTVPTTVTQEETTVPTVVPQGLSPSNHFFFPVLIPALLMFPVLIWCIWCCRRTVKEPPPVQKPEKEPETCPTVIVPCCGCQQDRIRQMEGKLDTLCNFVQSCNQVPLMWCQPRDKGRYISFTLVKPPCTQMPCSSEICLRPSQQCFPNSCCSWCQHPRPICSRPPSRTLSLILPPAQTLCRTALSLPPP
ncbi:PREDICTED: anthrax toxin receptor-like [Ceratotherium simum simum]|uniref:Anthrax toxin receptor-like n=1 Tax=Ceratotherium simum simum TaxID=73337 RepID=A0ABM1CYA1_CERSS|nr:PREDICTED: anthrax toxin receptor-like [Ceratotherium simum simum]